MKLKAIKAVPRQALALLMAAALAVAAALPCYAEGTAETAAPQGDTQQATAATQAEILAELRQLTPGTDYKENCLLLYADSEQDAAACAAALGAQVTYYSNGAATLQCSCSVAEAMTAAMAFGDDFPLVYPNHIYHMTEVEPDITEDAYSAGSAPGAAIYNDPALGSQWYHSFIGSVNAWTNGVTGTGVTVAVLDSGIVSSHPDLQVARYSTYPGFSSPYDSNGHGTSVAGVIAALANNGVGGVGVAPGVTLISCKAADDEDNFYDDTLHWGIHDAVDAGADVINISCNFPSDNNGYLAEAIAYAKNHGCVIVASSGNEGSNAPYYLPAHTDVIGVGALETNGTRANYSNFGANVNIMAPGTSLYTPGLGGSYNPYFGATSGAAAVVSGAVALIISADSSLRATANNGTGGAGFVDTVTQRLYSSAHSMYDANYDGCGAVNVSTLSYTATNTQQISEFVTRLYEVCLERQPDAAGLADWTAQLASGAQTGIQVACGFVFSDEFKQKNYCNTDYVKQLYRAFMGREYDDGGLAYWISMLEGGKKREEVFNGFAQSAEFLQLCSSYGIMAGSSIGIPQYGTVPTGPCSVCGEIDGVTSFVTRMYEVCLDRTPEADGLSYWTSRLWAHTESGRTIGVGFVFSDEFANHNYSNADYVEHLYAAFLGRASDEGGKAYWVSRLDSGEARLQVFDGFVYSQEFAAICNRYGISVE